MNKRFLRPVLAVCALSLPFALSAQSAPRKTPRTTPSTRPAAGGARPTTPAPQPVATTAPAEPAPAATPVPAPAPEPVVPAPRDDAPAAAPKGEHIRAGISAGLAAPMSSLGKTYTAGFTAGGFVHGRPEGFPVSLRGDLQYTRFPGKNKLVAPSYAIIQLTGAGVYDFPKAGGGKSPFFATAGLGLYRWSLPAVGVNPSESQTDFGQNLGLGFNFRRYRLQPFVEGRFHFFNDVQYFTLTAAAHF